MSEIARPAFGSWKAKAATTEASTTLPGITVLPDHSDRLVSCFQPQSFDLAHKLLNRQSSPAHTRLKYAHELALEGAMVFSGLLTQATSEIFGHVLDREGYRHSHSPQWFHYGAIIQSRPWHLNLLHRGSLLDELPTAPYRCNSSGASRTRAATPRKSAERAAAGGGSSGPAWSRRD